MKSIYHLKTLEFGTKKFQGKTVEVHYSPDKIVTCITVADTLTSGKIGVSVCRILSMFLLTVMHFFHDNESADVCELQIALSTAILFVLKSVIFTLILKIQ